jgi:hypothetical protein
VARGHRGRRLDAPVRRGKREFEVRRGRWVPADAHAQADGPCVETTAAGPRPRPPASRATLDGRRERRTSIPLGVRQRGAKNLADITLAMRGEAPNYCLQPTRPPGHQAGWDMVSGLAAEATALGRN